MTIDYKTTPATILGASRGVGRALAERFATLGAPVLAVARGKADLDRLARDVPGIATLACDMAEETAPALVLARQAPKLLIVAGGAVQASLPFQNLDFEQFSSAWTTDLRTSFNFLKAALLGQIADGSTIITITSGAMLNGSPISGGYAGAKKMQMFLSGYAQKEADRAGRALRFLSLAPIRLMPGTGIGDGAVRGYAAYSGQSEAAFLQQVGPGQTLTQVTDAVVTLMDSGASGGHYGISPEGLAQLT